jgi:hypothetical protein
VGAGSSNDIQPVARFATFITLLLVPVLYSIFVLDLKLINWERKEQPQVVADAAGAAD